MTATAGVTLRLAAIYNVLFGAICVLAPDWWFSIA